MRRCMCDPRLIPGPLVFHLETTKPVKICVLRYRRRRSFCSQRARCALSDDLIASTCASQPFDSRNLNAAHLPVREAPGRPDCPDIGNRWPASIPAYATLPSARWNYRSNSS